MGEYPLLRSLRKSRSQRFLSSYQSLIRAVPDMIDTKTQEIKAADKETYSDMRDVGDELPDSSPRFVLLSYPLTLVSHELRGPSVCDHLQLWHSVSSRVDPCFVQQLVDLEATHRYRAMTRSTRGQQNSKSSNHRPDQPHP